MYHRTARARQGDTLDGICYRYFGDKSNALLPQMIALNPTTSPTAILPLGVQVILPKNEIQPNATIRLWD